LGPNGNLAGALCYVASSEPRWFWEYWPNSHVTDFYYALGPANSVGPEGAWHTYQILSNGGKGWVFLLDGNSVFSLNTFFFNSVSKDPVYVAAEEVTSSSSASGDLGPVELHYKRIKTVIIGGIRNRTGRSLSSSLYECSEKQWG
jgi:hypothetical protein